MGSKTNVPPPDPRLVEAQVKSMGVQDQAAASILDIAKQQASANAELLPLQKEAMQFGLDANKTAYEQSQADRGWLLGRRDALTGMQDKMVSEANTFNSAAEGERRAQAAQTEVTKNFGDVQAAESRALASMGVNPASGRAMSSRGVDLARASVGAANAERLAARNEGRMLTDRAVNSLAGYPAAASGQSGAGASYAAGGVNVANAGAGGINAGYGAMTGAQQAAGGVAGGMGANAANLYGIQSGANANAQNSQNELFGTGLGAVTTLGAAFI